MCDFQYLIETRGLIFFQCGYVIQLICYISELISLIPILKYYDAFYWACLLVGIYFYVIQSVYAFYIVSKRHVFSITPFIISCFCITLGETFSNFGILYGPYYETMGKYLSPTAFDLLFFNTVIDWVLLLFFIIIAPMLYRTFKKEFYMQERINQENRVKFDYLSQFQVYVRLSIMWQFMCFLGYPSLAQDAFTEENGMISRFYLYSVINVLCIVLFLSSAIACLKIGINKEKLNWIYQFLIIQTVLEMFKIVEIFLLEFATTKYYTNSVYTAGVVSTSELVCLVITIVTNIEGLKYLKELNTTQLDQTSNNTSIRLSSDAEIQKSFNNSL